MLNRTEISCAIVLFDSNWSDLLDSARLGSPQEIVNLVVELVTRELDIKINGNLL